MVILLDTHIAYWLIVDDKKMPAFAKRLLSSQGNEFYYSLASEWEVEIKHERHPDAMPLSGEQFANALQEAGVKELPIRSSHIRTIPSLRCGSDHHDPFDRLLLASAKAEGFSFLSADKAFDAYDEPAVLLCNDPR